MKSLIQRLASTGLALFAMSAAIPEAKATNVTLDGYGYYSIGNTVKFYGSGAKQTGRYRNLGRDYYHSTTIRMDFVTNNSNNRSGDMSFEFWAMPYYDATSGIILMTRGVDPLLAGGSNRDFSKKGKAISLDARRFPELNLWEYTRKGWKFRDALTFKNKAWL
ncbi:MAG: hypothetical protein V4584_11125 [Verrucomicrobiota bacterium]